VSDSVLWNPRDSRGERPPLDTQLSDWSVDKRRATHLNAKRHFNAREYHLKWFFRRFFSGNPGQREFNNARRIKGLGIPTVVAVGWGYHPLGTFFVMEGSPGVPVFHLPEFPEESVLRKMSLDLGRLVALLHNANLCHRDLYVDHVLIHDDALRLIDVERVMKFRRRRWIIKDLGGLLFSAWREKLAPSLCRAFLRSYLAHSDRCWNRKRLITAVQRKAHVYWRHNDHRPYLSVTPHGQEE